MNTRTALGADQWSREEVALFNPAFMSLMLRQFIVGFRSYAETDPHIALTMVGTVLPLHRRTRLSLPPTVRTDLLEWLSRHGEIRFLHPKRVSAMMPLLREGLVYGIQRDLLVLDEVRLGLGSQRISAQAIQGAKGDAGACFESSRKTGRWLAACGPVAYQLSLWGIAP